MQASQDRISYLFQQHFAGNLTPAEREAFFDLINKGEEDALLKELMNNTWQQYAPARTAPQEWSKSVFEEITGKDSIKPAAHRVHFLKTAWFRYAAAVIVILATGTWFWLRTPTYNNPLNPNTVVHAADIPPGRDGAVLTLADGSMVVLDSITNGLVARQQGSNVIINNGQLIYAPAKGLTDGEIMYNTISTARGRQFQLMLPDGSMVWLNAASSIKFPTAFADGSRKVEVTGEAYFEVKENKNKPFFVSAGNTQVQVLGTSFNINSYADEEKIKTTLVEGSINVTANNSKEILSPGQQAQIRNSTTGLLQNNRELVKVQPADIDQVMAWKNGLFNFKDATLAEVMRQLARWYDITVQYENGIPDIDFEGKLGRDVSFSKMLVFFRESGVDFRMENGNTLIIIKKT